MARIRHSGPDYGLGFQVKVFNTFRVVPFSLGTSVRGIVLVSGIPTVFISANEVSLTRFGRPDEAETERAGELYRSVQFSI